VAVVGIHRLLKSIAGAGLVAVMAGVEVTSGFFVWTAPAWLVWYAYARHVRSGQRELAQA